MTTKLTLTIEGKIIDSAKVYARKTGKSLSDIVENYLKSLTSEEETKGALPPKISRLMGSITLPDDFDYKKDLGERLMKKYK